MFGFFKKKPEATPELEKAKKAGEDFTDFAKKMYEQATPEDAFFMLTFNKKVGGKMILGDKNQIGQLFADLFTAYPQLLSMVEGFIKDYKSGKLKPHDTTPVPPSQETIDAFNNGSMNVSVTPDGKIIGGDIEEPKLPDGMTIEDVKVLGPDGEELGDEADAFVKALFGGLINKKKEAEDKDPFSPKNAEKEFEKMKKKHDEFNNKLREDGIDGFNLDDIRKRNEEEPDEE